jgi:GH25 family lysozyme M1 (1,4-beta-N-acetylmuramidase)
MSFRKLALCGLGLGLTVAMTAGATLHASAHPQGIDRTPSAAAARAGVTASGGGYMGWAAHSQQLKSGLNPVFQSQAVSPMSGVTVPGIDVSSYQYPVNWTGWYGKGKRFAYIKATEGTSYRNPHFGTQYYYAYQAKFIRGAYHFGRPDGASGAAQAKYFVAHGGSWSRDGRTLPGVLDMEQNYSGTGACYRHTDAYNVAWVKSFVKEYKLLTGRDAVIYTNTTFWKTCMGNTTAFRYTNPIWIAYYATPLRTLPGGWPFYTFWQYSGSGMDQDKFSNSLTRLRALALG